MELFNENGCITDNGLQALIRNKLDDLGRLEASEHLAYCDKCLNRYTVMLTPDVIEQPEHSVSGPVLRSVWAQMMQSTVGRGAVAAVAAVLALTFWTTGTMRRQEWKQQQTSSAAVSTASVATQMWDSCTDFISNSLKLPALPTGNGGNNQ